MKDCLFCKIINKEIPAEIIYEDDDNIGILDVHPVAPGHAMILPKHHAYGLLELPEKKVKPLFLAVRKVAGKLKSALGADAFTIGINNGRVSGQAIDHLHVHIIPRFADDGGKSLHSVVNNPPKESLREIKNKINDRN